MLRPVALLLILAAVVAAVIFAVRRPAEHSTAVTVRDAIVAAPTASPVPVAPAPARRSERERAATPAPPTSAEPSATAAPILVTGAPASAAPTPTPLPTAAARPVPVQNNVPVVAAPPTNTVPRLAAEAPPRILSVALSNQTVSAGDVVNGQVQTTSNVASVEASVAGYVTPLQKTGVGRFALAYRVPQLPFFLRHRTYNITVTAHNVRGDSIQTSVPIRIQ